MLLGLWPMILAFILWYVPFSCISRREMVPLEPNWTESPPFVLLPFFRYRSERTTVSSSIKERLPSSTFLVRSFSALVSKLRHRRLTSTSPLPSFSDGRLLPIWSQSSTSHHSDFLVPAVGIDGRFPQPGKKDVAWSFKKAQVFWVCHRFSFLPSSLRSELTDLPSSSTARISNRNVQRHLGTSSVAQVPSKSSPPARQRSHSRSVGIRLCCRCFRRTGSQKSLEVDGGSLDGRQACIYDLLGEFCNLVSSVSLEPHASHG